MLNKFGEVIENASLENYNTYGIKTSCKYLVKPSSTSNTKDLVNYLNNENIPYLVLGKGSNVILPDHSYMGCIISLENLNHITFNNEEVEAECGTILGLLVKKTIANSLQGLEDLANIPGTVGGALYGNAGANNSTIYDHLEWVEVLHNGKLVTLKKEEITILYRQTSFMGSNDILLKAHFLLNKGNKNDLQEIVKRNAQKRRETQPLEFKNAGSVFKNPEGLKAGKLIDDLGLKNYHVNDAYVSLKHANFIINKKNATSKDIKDLIFYIKKRVKDAYNVELSLEQNIIEWD